MLDKQYRIEKVLRSRTLLDGTIKLLVRWKGSPVKYNSCIKEIGKYDVGAE